MSLKIKNEVDTEILLASSRMTVLEALDTRSNDYIAGLLDGIELQTDLIYTLLSPVIQRMNETINRTLASREL